MNGRSDERPSELSECWKIIHIPEEAPVSPRLQSTVNVIAAAIEPKHANFLVRKLNQIAPLENLRHVKRIHKKCLDGGKTQLFVILCIASGDGESNHMSENVLELVNTYQLSTFITKVCKFAASTKEQWEEQCKLWPTSFHPPTYNIDGITGFSEEDSLSVFNFMKFAVCLAKSGVRIVNAAVIVDPSTRQVVACSCDQVQSCIAPMNSISMETSSADQLKATTQYEMHEMKKDPLLLSKCSSDEAKQSYISVSCLHPLGWLDQRLQSSPGSWHPLQHAAIEAIEKSAARDRHLFPLNGCSVDFAGKDHKVSSPSGSPSKRPKINSPVKDDASMERHTDGFHCNSTRPYLCTGYDIYFVWEPCIMCAMAIVHQRIKRVFYAFPNPNNGALGSVYRLQGEKSLNHHYAVFRVMLPEDILKDTSLAIPAEIDQSTTQITL